jgi:hypothetical protein
MEPQYSLVEFLVTKPDKKIVYWKVPLLFSHLSPHYLIDAMKARMPEHEFKMITMAPSSPEEHKKFLDEYGIKAITVEEIKAARSKNK